MSINDLPKEVLVRILSFLPPSDRLKSALTCRRWAQAVATPALTRDVWLELRGCLIKESVVIISRTRRQYQNIRLFGGTLFHFDLAMWTKIGMSLRHLQFFGCEWSPDVFYSILSACTNLESLTIGSKMNPLASFHLPLGMNLEKLRKSTRNVHHLHLNFSVNADMLEQMLMAMPNVSSIALSAFDRESNFLDRLPNILGRSCGITMINLKPENVFKDKWEQLLSVSHTSLRELWVKESCTMTRQLYEALGNCRMLRDLRIKLNEHIDDDLLQSILRNAPQLEILELDDCPRTLLSHEALMPIPELKSLRKLELGRRVGDVDETRFWDLALLPNLRELTIQNLTWHANCLKIIALKLRKLRRLAISRSMRRDGKRIINHQNSESERDIVESAIYSEPGDQEELESSCLEYLKMTDIPLTDVGLIYIAAHHGRLKHLVFVRCNYITDVGLEILLKQETLLERLEVCFWKTTNGSFLEALNGLCPRLSHLTVSRCSNISPSAVELFRSRRPKVSVDTN